MKLAAQSGPHAGFMRLMRSLFRPTNYVSPAMLACNSLPSSIGGAGGSIQLLSNMLLPIGFSFLFLAFACVQVADAQISVGGKITTGGGSGGELTISTAGGSVTGVPIGETAFADFVQKLKSLQVGVDTADQVTNLMGKPSQMTKKANEEIWSYNYLIADDSAVAEYEICNRDLVALEQRDMEWSKKAFKKLDILKKRQKLTDQFTTQAESRIAIGQEGKLSGIQVLKISSGSSEVLYSKGSTDPQVESTAEATGLVPVLSAAPGSPKPGQIYLNTSEKAFYGWDGTAWVRLGAN